MLQLLARFLHRVPTFPNPVSYTHLDVYKRQVFSLANIIDQIIEIDSTAQAKLDEATHMKDEIKKVTEQKIAEIKERIQQEADKKAEACRAEEQKKIDAQKEEICKKEAEEIKRFEQLYQEKHQELEKEIFKNIIETSH